MVIVLQIMVWNCCYAWV